jgi:hypothetical protein
LFSCRSSGYCCACNKTFSDCYKVAVENVGCITILDRDITELNPQIPDHQSNSQA